MTTFTHPYDSQVEKIEDDEYDELREQEAGPRVVTVAVAPRPGKRVLHEVMQPASAARCEDWNAMDRNYGKRGGI